MTTGNPNAYLQQIAEYSRRLASAAEIVQNERIREMEKIRAIKYMSHRVDHSLDGATTMLIAGNQINVRQGWSWNLKAITGQLSASDSVSAWLAEAIGQGPVIGYAPAPGAAPGQLVFIISWGSSQRVLNSGESIFLATSGTGNLSNVTVSGVQVPAEEIGKLIR